MIQEPPSKTWIPVTAAIITGACAVIAAIVTLGAPFAERMADRYYPPFTPTPNSSGSAPLVMPPASTTDVVMSQTQMLGEWLYQQPRAPMPAPAGENQVIFAHGDIDNSGTCHVKEFKTGETIQGLGLGGFRLWLITGTPEYIKDVETQLQKGAAAHARTDCPYLP
jgi:hypothetical protein